MTTVIVFAKLGALPDDYRRISEPFPTTIAGSRSFHAPTTIAGSRSFLPVPAIVFAK